MVQLVVQFVVKPTCQGVCFSSYSAATLLKHKLLYTYFSRFLPISAEKLHSKIGFCRTHIFAEHLLLVASEWNIQFRRFWGSHSSQEPSQGKKVRNLPVAFVITWINVLRHLNDFVFIVALIKLINKSFFNQSINLIQFAFSVNSKKMFCRGKNTFFWHRQI